jgi:oligopeptide/dipeptide ABC transporter ATP-binding protein
MTVREIVQEPLNVHEIGARESRRKQVEELVEIVGLRKQVLSRYPHEFSGGQRQRVGIARALALKPKFIVADEAVSALDVSVQSQVLNLITELQERFGITFLFISHDLSVINHVSHTVGVMYLGKIVEKTSTKNLYQTPKHPYTKALLSAIPIPDPEKKRTKIVLEGDVPSPLNPPSGCTFHPRCPQAMDICKIRFPQQINLGTATSEHLISCHLYS